MFTCTLTTTDRIEKAVCHRSRNFPGVHCEVRLWVLHLFPMHYWSFRGDLVCLWRILHDDIEPELHAEFPLRICGRTRVVRLPPRKLNVTGLPLAHRFSSRVTSLWNSFSTFLVEKDNGTGYIYRLKHLAGVVATRCCWRCRWLGLHELSLMPSFPKDDDDDDV